MKKLLLLIALAGTITYAQAQTIVPFTTTASAAKNQSYTDTLAASDTTWAFAQFATPPTMISVTALTTQQTASSLRAALYSSVDGYVWTQVSAADTAFINVNGNLTALNAWQNIPSSFTNKAGYPCYAGGTNFYPSTTTTARYYMVRLTNPYGSTFSKVTVKGWLPK